MNKNTLLTAWEVVRYNPIDQNISVTIVSRFIYLTENKLAREYIGRDFYDLMLEDSADWSTVLEYNSQAGYVLDSLVSYRGLVYQALQASTGKLPSNTAYWTEAKKFTIDAYNDLYYLHLREFISADVWRRASRFLYQQTKPGGIVLRTDAQSGANSVTWEEFSAYRNDVATIERDLLDNMEEWISQHKDDDAYLLDGVSIFDDFNPASCSGFSLLVSSRKFYFRKDYNDEEY